MKVSRRKIAAVCITLGVTGLVTWQTYALPNPEGAATAHRAIRDAADGIPERVGNWRSTPITVTQAAVKLLKPNVLAQRRWSNVLTGEAVTALIVHCGDSRDMLGHYPPVCYPGQGWRMAGTEDWSAEAGGRSYTMPEYEFVTVKGMTTEGIWVRNAMLLPGVGLGRDMDAVTQTARDVSRRYLGAGQLQFVFPHGVPQADRDRITRDLMEIYAPVLESVSTAGRAEGEKKP